MVLVDWDDDEDVDAYDENDMRDVKDDDDDDAMVDETSIRWRTARNS